MSVETAFGSYRTVDERNPEFLDKYPPDQGFGVRIYIRDLLYYKPGLLRLYVEAIKAGRDLSDCGLPKLPEPNGFIVEARLVRSKNVLGSACHYLEIATVDDVPTAEKRARHRLLDSLGFPGDADAPRVQSEPSSPSVPKLPALDDNDPVDMSEQLGDFPPADNVTPIPSGDSALPPALESQCERHIARLKDAGVSKELPTTKEGALALLRTPVPESDDSSDRSETS